MYVNALRQGPEARADSQSHGIRAGLFQIRPHLSARAAPRGVTIRMHVLNSLFKKGSPMEIRRPACAGTMESSDIMVSISQADAEGIQIDLTSVVEKQFGRRIREVITDVLQNEGVTSAYVHAVDKGALDCTVRARTRCALQRACQGE